ncbi:MAG: 5'-3' exonuclease H3TH domain-containing protein [Candidatus Binatia bacterium]
MPKLHLLDATYELFRAFFAMPREQGSDGREVGAIRGLIGSVLALLRQPEVTHIAAATDHVIESFRNALFPGYKSGAGVAPELLSQFSLAEDALRALGVVVWPMIEFEADDALATAAARFASEVAQVVILSPDKDLCQCVRGQRVVVHDRRKGTTLDEVGVQAKFGVPPCLIPDLLALVGDTADGIPGIPGWGVKTAAAVLRAHGPIEHIPDEVGRWTARLRNTAAPAAALRARRAEASLYKRLAILRTDVPLAETLADLAWRGVPRAAYQDLCRRFGFRQLADRPAKWTAE